MIEIFKGVIYHQCLNGVQRKGHGKVLKASCMTALLKKSTPASFFLFSFFHIFTKLPLISGNLLGASEVFSIVQEVQGIRSRTRGAIVTEKLAALDDFDIDKITGVINEIHNSRNIAKILTASIFIALPKKQMQMNAISIKQSAH